MLFRGELVSALLATCVAVSGAVAVPHPATGAQATEAAQASSRGHKGRKLHGRFLQITDIHPDPFYKTYSSTSSDAVCHRQRGPAGAYGAETSDCDSPYSLVNATFKWINEHLADKIDFVVWTGDSARHDNDEDIPRTTKQVISQNEYVVGKFAEVFGTDETASGFTIPIVPTFGNNDILPHNIFLDGPNKWTKRYLDIWRGFVPEAQRHGFQQGGWFYVEVIPNELAVFSLNTLYFFDSNSGVNGCASKHEPGYEHMDWLRIQLRIMRERGMKAILMGHVPPARTNSKMSWDETCWQKYTLWMNMYRDVIAGSLFGHMNLDHFILHDFKDISKDAKRGEMGNAVEGLQRQGFEDEWDGEIGVLSATDYLSDLGDLWAKLPSPPKGKGKKGKGKGKSVDMSEHDKDEEEEEDESLSVWQWLVSKITSSEPKRGNNAGKKPKRTKKQKFLHRIGGKYAQRFSVSNVAPSVVPNYFPTLRVFEYNISGLEGHVLPHDFARGGRSANTQQTPISFEDADNFDSDDEYEISISINEEANSTEQHDVDAEGKKHKKKHKKKKNKKKHGKPRPERKWSFKLPTPPPANAAPGPAYMAQRYTLLGYTQWYANLTEINNDFDPPAKNLTLTESDSLQVEEDDDVAVWEVDGDEDDEGEDVVEGKGWREGKHKKHQGKKPRPKPHPRKFEYQVEYDTRDDKVFGMKDLTVRSFLRVAGRIGGDKVKRRGSGVGVGVEGEEGGEDAEVWWDEDGEPEMEEEMEEEDDDTSNTSVGKKHKKHRKHKHKRKHTSAWYTFVQRAFVGTMDPRDMEENFGAIAHTENLEDGERSEL